MSCGMTHRRLCRGGRSADPDGMPGHETTSTLSELTRGLRRGELRVHYQPQVSLVTREIVGVEALVRWQSPRLGLVAPSGFVPLAEKAGLMPAVGGSVLEVATRQMAEWVHILGAHAPSTMWLNCSAAQVLDASMVPSVDDALASSGLEPARLGVEITEATLLDDVEQASQVLRALGERGVRLAVDDFGTGFSSMLSVKKLAVDVLKLDRRLVAELAWSDVDAAFVSATVGIARALGIDVVAEGIEDEAQMQRAAALGCGVGQGYHFSPPASTADFEELLVRTLRADGVLGHAA